MNKVWLIMLIASIGMIIFIDPSQILSGLSVAANKAVKLTLELFAIYAVWVGIFSILEQTGLSKKLTKLLSPLIDLIFGKNQLDKQSKEYVSMNMSANMLGMNGAATPMGIKAIESMNKDNKSGEVTFPMTMLIILSCTSLQFLPTSIMGILSSSGSSNPTSILLPSIVASIFSTLTGIILVRIWNFLKNKRSKAKHTKEKKSNG